jgi:hypothetical protein
MWILLATWIVGDDGLELGEGDRWSTVLEVSPHDAEVVSPHSPQRFELVGDPLSVAGPRYDIVARVRSDEASGSFLDAGEVYLTASVHWPPDTVLSLKTELQGGWYPAIPPPDHLIFDGEIQRLFIRQRTAVSDGAPNSYRPDLATARFRQIERIQMWEAARDLDGPHKIISDYLLELV